MIRLNVANQDYYILFTNWDEQSKASQVFYNKCGHFCLNHRPQLCCQCSPMHWGQVTDPCLICRGGQQDAQPAAA